MTLDYAISAQDADQITLDLAVDGKQQRYTRTRRPGTRRDTLEIAFHPYPKGALASIDVAAEHAGNSVGSGHAQATLAANCTALTLAIGSAPGGPTGSGGNAGSSNEDQGAPPDPDDLAMAPPPPDLMPPADLTPPVDLTTPPDLTPLPPPIVSFVGDTATPQFPSGTTNTAYEDACPPGQALIGFNLWVQHDASGADQGVDRADGLCAPPDVEPDGKGGYTVAWGKVTVLTGHGVEGQSYVQYACNSGSFLTGFFGRSGLYLDRLALSCAPIVVAPSRAVSVGKTVDSNTGIGSTTGGSAFGPVYCPSGQLATTVRTREQAAFPFDAFGYGCSAVVGSL